MRHSIYLNAKQLVRSQAKELKRTNNNKGYIRYELNNLCDSLCKQFNFYAMKETISKKQAALYSNWLASFTADMHPNN